MPFPGLAQSAPSMEQGIQPMRKLLLPSAVAAVVALIVSVTFTPAVVSADNLNAIDVQQNQRLDNHDSDLIAHERELNGIQQPAQVSAASITTTAETTVAVGICSRFDHTFESDVEDGEECAHFQRTGTRTIPGEVTADAVNAGRLERKADYWAVWTVTGASTFKLIQAPSRASNLLERPPCLTFTGSGSARITAGSDCGSGHVTLVGDSGNGTIALSLHRYR